MEEVGSPREGQEEDLGPPHRSLNLEGEGPKGVKHHRRLPYKEGGTADEACASPAHDGAWASLDGIVLAEGALSPSKVAQRIKKVMEPPWDDVGGVLEFVYPVPGHPPTRPEPGYIVFVSFLSLCLLFN